MSLATRIDYGPPDSDAEGPQAGRVYLALVDEFHKIGSTCSPGHRFSAMKAMLERLGRPGAAIRVLHTIPSVRRYMVERVLQQRFAASRVQGELFRLSAEEVEEFCRTGRADTPYDLPGALKPGGDGWPATPIDDGIVGPLDAKALGRRFARLRTAAGLTRMDISRATGITDSTIAAFEAGRPSLSLRSAERLAPTVGISPQRFLGLE